MVQVLSTPDAVIAAIQERHKVGLSLSSNKVQEENLSLYRSACKVFGIRAWRKALTAAGFDYDSALLRPQRDKSKLTSFRYPKRQRKNIQARQLGTRAIKKPWRKPHILEVFAKKKPWYTPRMRCISLRPWKTPKVYEVPSVAMNKGLLWWTSLKSEEKLRAIRPLIEKFGMTFARVAEHLELESRSRVAGIWCRYTLSLKRPGAVIPFRRKRRALGRTKFLNLDAPAARDSKTTRGELVGFNDPSFARMESLQLLESLLNKRKLADNAAVLLKRLILGDDLEETEYRQLASAIRQHTDLLDMVSDL